MGWREVLPMDQRIGFISDYHRHVLSFSDLCACYGVSRKTGYKWVNRYRDYGVDGLKERSRRPHGSSHRTPDYIRDELIRLRKQYGWGVSKLFSIIRKRRKDWKLPAYSTGHDILRQENLLTRRRRRRRLAIMQQPFPAVDRPNQVWSVDYKGQFKTRDGVYCYPLTVVDAYSRFLLACQVVSGTTFREARDVFTRLFASYGMPDRIRSDNGIPFASTSIGGLSRLSIWWMRLGIRPERITPGKPQENGRHERMHRTLKAEAIHPPALNHAQQQQHFDRFRKRYNTIRPHEALNMQPPATHYHKSKRRFPKHFPVLHYPDHYHVRLVNYNGCICWHNAYIYISYLLKGENVGCLLLEKDRYEIYYSHLRIGFFYEQDVKKGSSITANRYGKV
jgi:putative transposase